MSDRRSGRSDESRRGVLTSQRRGPLDLQISDLLSSLNIPTELISADISAARDNHATCHTDRSCLPRVSSALELESHSYMNSADNDYWTSLSVIQNTPSCRSFIGSTLSHCLEEH